MAMCKQCCNKKGPQVFIAKYYCDIHPTSLLTRATLLVNKLLLACKIHLELNLNLLSSASSNKKLYSLIT